MYNPPYYRQFKVHHIFKQYIIHNLCFWENWAYLSLFNLIVLNCAQLGAQLTYLVIPDVRSSVLKSKFLVNLIPLIGDITPKTTGSSFWNQRTLDEIRKCLTQFEGDSLRVASTSSCSPLERLDISLTPLYTRTTPEEATRSSTDTKIHLTQKQDGFFLLGGERPAKIKPATSSRENVCQWPWL